MDGDLCCACGMLTHWVIFMDGRRARYHFVGHEDLGELCKHVFRPHTPEACADRRRTVLLRLRDRGALA